MFSGVSRQVSGGVAHPRVVAWFDQTVRIFVEVDVSALLLATRSGGPVIYDTYAVPLRTIQTLCLKYREVFVSLDALLW